MNPHDPCNTICAQKKSNFLYATAFLPSDRRQGLKAFYAFCASVDEAVDGTQDKGAARQRLAEWRLEVDRMYVSVPVHPVAVALTPHLRALQIPRAYLDEIINGCAMDIDKSRYATFAELELYCYRVASCVGLVCLNFFDIPTGPDNTKAAIALGKALQITNIVRDVGEDAKRGRIYLPEEDFRRFSVESNDLMRPSARKEILQLLLFELERARSYFAEGYALLPEEKKGRRKWLPALLMARAYESLLDSMQKKPHLVFGQKVRISSFKKLTIASKTLFELYSPVTL